MTNFAVLRSSRCVLRGCLLCLIWTAGCGAPASDPASPASSKNRAASPAATAIRFQDATDESGIEFTYRNGQQAGHYSILETLGGGVGVLDYDVDGRPDLLFPGGGILTAEERIRGLPSALYRNSADGRFTETSGSAGVQEAHKYSHGVAVGDYNSDGFPDLLVTGYGGLVLYKNLGDGTFREVSASAGLDESLWSTGAAWGDVNGDGLLDLYVAHYVNWSFENNPECRSPTGEKPDVCAPREFDGLPDRLYENRGDGTFQDVSDKAGLKPGGKGLGVLIGDVDLDGDVDIYVANDTTVNFLYQNDGHGQFQEIGRLSSTAYDNIGTPNGSMGVDLGDFNADGLPDLWVANFERESFALYRNNGHAAFDHVSRVTGITDVGGLYVGWGTAFLDCDNDRDEDLICANGHVLRHPINAPVRQPPLLFENRAGQRYVNVASLAGAYLNSEWEGRGLAVADLDVDGREDVVISHQNEPVTVLANQTESGMRSITLDLVGTASNRDAVGAVVRVTAAGHQQLKQVCGGGSYLSASARQLHAGLGQAAEATVRIQWPSGLIETHPALPSGRWTVVEAQGVRPLPIPE